MSATPQIDLKEEKKHCGIVMPISSVDGCSPEHWSEVLRILKEVALEADYTTALVSDANEVGIIQKRIIQNLYSNDMIICDVSGKNPNVMFELGLRLAFDKPTIIVKDDATDYSFDTSPIEHLEYPRDLRYSKILKFRSSLKDKLIATRRKFETNPNASMFLKEFGEFHVARLETREVSPDQFIVESLTEIRSELAALKSAQRRANGRKNWSVKEAVQSIRDHIDSVATTNGIEKPYLREEIMPLRGQLSRIPSVREGCGSPEIFSEAFDIVLNDYEEIPF